MYQDKERAWKTELEGLKCRVNAAEKGEKALREQLSNCQRQNTAMSSCMRTVQEEKTRLMAKVRFSISQQNSIKMTWQASKLFQSQNCKNPSIWDFLECGYWQKLLWPFICINFSVHPTWKRSRQPAKRLCPLHLPKLHRFFFKPCRGTVYTTIHTSKHIISYRFLYFIKRIRCIVWSVRRKRNKAFFQEKEKDVRQELQDLRREVANLKQVMDVGRHFKT